MRTVLDMSWSRRGMSLLWCIDTLLRITTPDELLPMRDFFQMESWPEELPSAQGRAVIVAGLDGCLDSLEPEQAEAWLSTDVRNKILSFQDEYEGQAALIFWVPNGRNRIQVSRSNGSFMWKCGASVDHASLPFGKCLWAGAEEDVIKVLDGNQSTVDPDGSAWIGLHHPRIS